MRGSIAPAFAAIALAASALTWWAPASASDRSPVRVGLRDFEINSHAPVTDAGLVTLHVTNTGPSTHEINVDRTTLSADDLPIGRDGITVNEDSKQLRRIGSIEVLKLGDSKDLTLRLRPGHYVLWCNLDGHYLGGMQADLDVKAKP